MAGLDGGFRAGLHYAQHGQGGEGLAQGGQGRGRGRVAGHHQHFYAHVHQGAGGLEGVADDGVAALGAVRQAGRITEVDKILMGQAGIKGFEHGKAPHAGIKQPHGQGGGMAHGVSFKIFHL